MSYRDRPRTHFIILTGIEPLVKGFLTNSGVKKQRSELHSADLAGCSILIFDVGFWVPLCREKLPDTFFLLQTDVDAMDELVEASNLLVFNSDQMLADGYVPRGRKNLPLREDFAAADYYLCCLDAEKGRYAPIFRALPGEAARGSA